MGADKQMIPGLSRYVQGATATQALQPRKTNFDSYNFLFIHFDLHFEYCCETALPPIADFYSPKMSLVVRPGLLMVGGHR